MSRDDLIKAAIKAVVDGDDQAAVSIANKVIAEALIPLRSLVTALPRA
jgi:methanogenic corrinoid protein MtbC1